MLITKQIQEKNIRNLNVELEVLNHIKRQFLAQKSSSFYLEPKIVAMILRKKYKYSLMMSLEHQAIFEMITLIPKVVSLKLKINLKH